MKKNSTTTTQAPVYLPVAIIILALSTIASTLLPSQIQQQPTVFGCPLILCFWLTATVLSAVLIVIAAWRIIRNTDNE